MSHAESGLPKNSDLTYLQIDGRWIAVANTTAALDEFCKRFAQSSMRAEPDANTAAVPTPEVLISSQNNGLRISWQSSQAKPLHYQIDITNLLARQYSYPAAKNGPLNQALGKRSREVLDATAGWGGDALLMCTQGYRLIMLERNPLMVLMLDDAMTRLAKSDWARTNQVAIPRVHEQNAIDYMGSIPALPDCIYLDPMFPAKRKKSAAVNKNMQFLQWLIGADVDATTLCQAAISTGVARVVVKRPDYAEPLVDNPSQVFSGKLVHYDVYLRS